jgi:hypothetical protein
MPFKFSVGKHRTNSITVAIAGTIGTHRHHRLIIITAKPHSPRTPPAPKPETFN